MKVALVYDRINKWGGAERVLLALHELFPEAPLYTSVYDSQGAPWASVFPKIIPSFLQKFPFAKKNHEFYPYLMPLAFESFRFDEYDLVISVTSEAAKGIITQPWTRHICYCLTPTRYLWQSYEDYFPNELVRFLTKPVVSYLRNWDKIAAQRPDVMIAISNCVSERIKKYYRRNSEVIYPPVELTELGVLPPRSSQPTSSLASAGARWDALHSRHPSPSSYKYFLVVSRLVPYKHIDIAIEAFNQLGWNLKIIGTGKEERKLREMAKENIEFLSDLTEEELLSYYKNCRALIFPGEEDFGLTFVEAQLLGKPVIAYGKGGALETVKEGLTGQFFYRQTAKALIECLKGFKVSKFKEEDCKRNAQKFSKERFKKEFMRLIK